MCWPKGSLVLSSGCTAWHAGVAGGTESGATESLATPLAKGSPRGLGAGCHSPPPSSGSLPVTWGVWGGLSTALLSPCCSSSPHWLNY